MLFIGCSYGGFVVGVVVVVVWFERYCGIEGISEEVEIVWSNVVVCVGFVIEGFVGVGCVFFF